MTASGGRRRANSAFDEADDLEIDGDFEVDLDLGVMAMLGGLRVGGSLRHLREPGFGEGGTAFLLETTGPRRGGVDGRTARGARARGPSRSTPM